MSWYERNPDPAMRQLIVFMDDYSVGTPNGKPIPEETLAVWKHFTGSEAIGTEVAVRRVKRRNAEGAGSIEKEQMVQVGGGIITTNVSVFTGPGASEKAVNSRLIYQHARDYDRKVSTIFLKKEKLIDCRCWS